MTCVIGMQMPDSRPFARQRHVKIGDDFCCLCLKFFSTRFKRGRHTGANFVETFPDSRLLFGRCRPHKFL
jgi:hypothetical protein